MVARQKKENRRVMEALNEIYGIDEKELMRGYSIEENSEPP